MNCRHCNSSLNNTFLDLGFAPPSNSYLSVADLNASELYFPLKIYVCDECWLVQTEDYSCSDELFTKDYAYFSSISSSWLKHASKYCEMIIGGLQLNEESFVIEIASNDGYLLKNFVSKGIPCLGIEPTESTAEAAEKIGIPVVQEFFGEGLGKQLAAEGKQADLIAGNNVYAHVPDINDFTKGLKAALKPGGTITLEFPHLMQLIKHTQFDTVYHEHFSYLSLCTVIAIFAKSDLKVYKVDEIATHGGSLRIYGCHNDDPRLVENSVNDVLQAEDKAGLRRIDTYEDFQFKAEVIKDNLLKFLIEAKRLGKKVVAYGAAAKGNTLLNFSGVKPDLVSSVFDAAPSKQGKFLPGSHIPILDPQQIKETKLDYLLILPWNLKSEVTSSHDYIREWGGKFVVAVPELKIL